MPLNKDAFKDKFTLSNGKVVEYISLPKVEKLGIGKVSILPFSIRIMLESLLRNMDNISIKESDVRTLANWDPKNPSEEDIPFKVARVLMQDFTGVPAVVDLASMRDYLFKSGVNPENINPNIPVDLIIDHSVQVDSFNSNDSIRTNQKFEISRNKERYELLKWASSSVKNFNVYPPSAGICHQINLEYLGKCIILKKNGSIYQAIFDTLVGTDSHTTMINALGVIGFGVGGIEAEAALLNEPVYLSTPKVVGVEFYNKLNPGVTATDLALTLTKILREKNVVNMFIEFFGSGLNSLTIPDRATLSNMCPEYGATIAVFYIDNQTIDYLKLTGRSDEQIDLIKKYLDYQNMLNIDYKKIKYSDTFKIDLSEIRASVSGPSLPKQHVYLEDTRKSFEQMLKNHKEEISIKDMTRWSSESAHNHSRINNNVYIKKETDKKEYTNNKIDLSDGDIVISSITSCTNTSNPYLMIAAGLLAKKAVMRGLKVNAAKVKTSFAPGSRVVTKYLEKANLLEYLDKLGYSIVGYGCITCIGNSGPLIGGQSEIINNKNLSVVSVLSGNRNYESRIHRDIRANYLMSPPLVVAFGIAGTILIDLTKDPIGTDSNMNKIYLKDIWPTDEEIIEVISKDLSRDMFEDAYGDNIYKVNPFWNNIHETKDKMFKWSQRSTYIKNPPFFENFDINYKKSTVVEIANAAILSVFGDSLSTDHISPAGEIGLDSPAGKYLILNGVRQQDFNTYGSRRGNHEVMMRGTFANNRIKNMIMEGKEGGLTKYFPTNTTMSIYDAAIAYKKEGRPTVVFGGIEYGSGSSRDWAAKGPALLGVKAIIASSFERIHRSNLVGMGVLPLQFEKMDNFASLKIDYTKSIDIIIKDLKPRSKALLKYTDVNNKKSNANLDILLNSENELNYYLNGGVLRHVLKRIINNEN